MTDPIRNEVHDTPHDTPLNYPQDEIPTTRQHSPFQAHHHPGQEAPCARKQLPRKLASEVNPLISDECTEDTLGRIADMLDVYGALLAGFNGNSAMYYCTETMFDPLAAALRYEVRNCRLECEGLRQVIEEAGWQGRA